MIEPLCRASLHVFTVGREKGSWIYLHHTQHLGHSQNPRSDCVGAPLVAPGTFSKIPSLALTFLVEKVQIPLSFALFVTNSDMRIHRVFQKGSKTKELLQP